MKSKLRTVLIKPEQTEQMIIWIDPDQSYGQIKDLSTETIKAVVATYEMALENSGEEYSAYDLGEIFLELGAIRYDVIGGEDMEVIDMRIM